MLLNYIELQCTLYIHPCTPFRPFWSSLCASTDFVLSSKDLSKVLKISSTSSTGLINPCTSTECISMNYYMVILKISNRVVIIVFVCTCKGCRMVPTKSILGNPGVYSVARYSLPEKYPWEQSLLELVLEVKITLVSLEGRPISIKDILVCIVQPP